MPSLININYSSGSNCIPQTGGIARLYIANAAIIDRTDPVTLGVTFAPNGGVSSIVFTNTETFKKITFEPDTAFYKVEKKVIGKGKSHTFKTLVEFHEKFNQDILFALAQLNSCEDKILIVVDNTGRMWLVGIDRNTIVGAATPYELRPVYTGDGLTDTGKDKETDTQDVMETFVNTHLFCYPAQLVMLESNLPVSV